MLLGSPDPCTCNLVLTNLTQCSNEDITRILTISYGIGMPFCIVGTYVVSRYGLRLGIYIGGILTFVGGLLCCLSTFPYLREHFHPDIWYWMSVTGQAMTGMGSPFIACVPTKISHQWFREKERIIATTILSLSNPVGIVIGQAVTPLFVQVGLCLTFNSFKDSIVCQPIDKPKLQLTSDCLGRNQAQVDCKVSG